MKKPKIVIDILMLVMLILSVFNWHINIIFHIITGNLFVCLTGIHTCLSFKWITGVTKAIKKGAAKGQVKLQYAVNIIVLAVWLLSITMGIILATKILGGIEVGFKVDRVHIISAIAACVLTAAHIFLHRKRLVMLLKKKSKQGSNQAAQ